MDPAGALLAAAWAADKHSSKDTRHFINFMDLMNFIKLIEYG